MVDATVLQSITEQLSGVQDLGNGILRGERRYQGKTFATAYIDLSDDVVQRADDLTSFQERLLGSDFFSADGDQRWNSYLYFLAGPKSREKDDFLAAKAFIEGDRHFARKFVLSEGDLLARLGAVGARAPVAHVSDDASVRWGDLLVEASLGVILEQRPRTQALELIGSGEAFVAVTSRTIKASPSSDNDPLRTGFLRNLRIGAFRPAVSDRDFSFGDVNLIFGKNGAGKTSLLESIEAFYCGRIRRDAGADFSGIEGDVVTQGGSVIKIKGETTAAIIKARNLSWYGRSSQQSSAISQSFTRFNFLDTDAAFRLASETSAEKIKEDLSLLLIGPEASTLWTYLTKLREDTLSKGAAAGDRVPLLLKQTELLGSEVKRLQEAPTNSTALARTYRSSLRALGATWDLGGDTATVNPSDRPRLESLSRGLRQAIAVARTTPVTARLLRDRALAMELALAALNNLARDYESVRVDIAATEALIRERDTNLQVLLRWMAYCEAGAPRIIASRIRTRAAIERVRSDLAGLSADALPNLPVEYATRPIDDALQAALSNLGLAVQQERAGVESLQQRERLGQSIDTLRSDLRDLVISVMERTGDSIHCPVCLTVHGEAELLHKIDALGSSEDPSATEGLRQAVMTARERAQQERGAVTALKVLQLFSATLPSGDSMLAGDVRDRLTEKHRELSALNDELLGLESAADALSSQGTDWGQYDRALAEALSILGSEEAVESLGILNGRIASLRKDIETSKESVSKLRERLTPIMNEAARIASTEGITSSHGSSPAELLTAVERASAIVDTSIAFVHDASEQINLDSEVPFEEIQLALDQIVADFDRVQHAERSEVTARTDLSKKTEDLHQTTEQLRDISTRRENFEKAGRVLSRIVQEHSLEQATQDALASISSQVSDVFARIHSPSEYVVGDFQNDTLLATREGGVPRGVHQVSTGQRAALALSIFLALNRSAESAPPVMLIDDPVAHIDDLNALSFLDYLRDLAVGTRRQIFFATADAKVAALFQKKFEFLGDRFKKITLVR
jgi:chromosome segregation protein